VPSPTCSTCTSPGTRYTAPSATYLAWVDCRALGLGDDPAETFRERGVELSAGPQFGAPGLGHVRINLATSPSILAELVRAMAG
jgi:cysteine-S-conjugate beta-lyase